MEKTLTEIINDFQNEVSKDNLLPQRASEIMVQLSALLGNINGEIRKRDKEYKLVLLECYKQEKTANRAKLTSEVSPEYEASKVAKDTKELALELIRSIKYYLKSMGEEFTHSNNF